MWHKNIILIMKPDIPVFFSGSSVKGIICPTDWSLNGSNADWMHISRSCLILLEIPVSFLLRIFINYDNPVMDHISWLRRCAVSLPLLALLISLQSLLAKQHFWNYCVFALLLHISLTFCNVYCALNIIGCLTLNTYQTSTCSQRWTF